MRKEGILLEIFKFEGLSKNTLENVFYSCYVLVQEKTESAIVVTDREHARRFTMLFNRAKKEGYMPNQFNFDTFQRV